MMYLACITSSCQGNQQNSKLFWQKGSYDYKQGQLKLCLQITKELVGTCRGLCLASFYILICN